MVRAPGKVDSIYDFIYVDARRIAVLVSQLNGGSDGVLVELTRDTKTASGTDGSVNLHIAKLGVNETGTVGLTKKFDPQWLAPLLLLDLANDQDLINRDAASAHLGELVLFQGELEIRDFRTTRAVLSAESLKSRLANTLKMDNKELLSIVGVEEGKEPTRAQMSAARLATIQMIIEIIGAMPGRAQVILKPEMGGRAWGVLREEGMIVSHEEIALTHGSSIPGTWISIGLLDARPDAEPPDAPSVLPTPEGFINTSTALNLMARKFVGRPYETYAITPLMIFRDIANA